VREHVLTAQLYRNPLAIVWGLLVSAFLVFLIFATPPMQVPDEQNHFLRVAQLAQGGVIGRRLNALDSGGMLPVDSVTFAHSYDDIPSHYDHKIQWSRLDTGSNLTWKSQRIPAGFPNTVIYSPVFYLPAVLGVEVGKVLHTNILTSFYLARISSSIFCLLVGFMALLVAIRGKLLIAVFLSMPMVLSLFASCSQDGPLIASCALCVALLTRVEDSFSERKWFWPGVALLLGCILASKPPYILMAFIPLVLAPSFSWRKAAGACGIAVALLMIWSLWGVHTTKVPFQSGQGVDSGRQVHFLLSHPIAGLEALLNTFHFFGSSFKQQFVGVLGWLDAPLPSWFYRFEKIILILTALISALYLSTKINKEFLLRKILIFTLCLGTACAVSVALYLIWTPVGLNYIEGIQGRYFIPLAIFSILMLPISSLPRALTETKVMVLEIIVLCVSLWGGMGAVLETVLARYW